jgi:hypothetical protein
MVLMSIGIGFVSGRDYGSRMEGTGIGSVIESVHGTEYAPYGNGSVTGSRSLTGHGSMR